MKFSGTVNIDKVRWVKQEEARAISILVENDGEEIDLSIKREELENLKGMAEEFLKGEARPENGKNSSFNVCLMLDGEKVSIDLGRGDVLPFPAMLIMKNTEGKEFHLFIDGVQARAIQEKLETFIHADDEFSKIKDTLSLNDPVPTA
ncbi:hypothetical protein KA005_12775 [bacterium]|nr:hypothetical protein [bacterium]